VALPGRRADRIISRSRSYYTSSSESSEDETESDADRPEAKPLAPNFTSPKHRKGHLYVVLDDWKKGFSIHKLDVDDGSDCSDLALRPPAYRQVAACLTRWNFAAVGSKIVAAGDIKLENTGKEDSGVTLVYNTETAGLSIVPDRLPTALCGICWLLDAAAMGGLYVFEDMSWKNTRSMLYNVSMHQLEEAPSPAFWWGTSDNWVWRSIPSPPAFNMAGRRTVQSIALHPEGGGRTIFVSQTQRWSEPTTGQTYSYDTGSGEWSDHGEWRLPFHGRGYYDTELDAWVGLSYLNGHICSCDVVSPDGSSPPPASKLCKERLFDPRTEFASLVYMGDNTYCIVKVQAQEPFKDTRCVGPGNKSMICLSIFRLKYDKNGDLTVTAREPDRCYLFRRYQRDSFLVRAFWV
jgi:hypothetical protein